MWRKPDNGIQTISDAKVFDDRGKRIFSFYMLELAWKNNQRSISCIPKGKYTVEKKDPREDGSRFNYPHFEVLDVPGGRQEIKWHRGNYNHEIRGCMLPGKTLHDLNDDGEMDVTDSKRTLQKLWDMLPERFQLTII